MTIDDPKATKPMMQRITPELPGADIYYIERFLSVESGTRLFDLLLASSKWSRRQFMGRAVPRSEIYVGDPGTEYTYSNRAYEPLPWIPQVETLRPGCSTLNRQAVQFSLDEPIPRRQR